jgi:phosphatidate phosphatase APP1
MKVRVPILLGFYGLSNGSKNVFFGKLAYSYGRDLTFKNYNRLKTFKTIVALYTSRPVRNTHFTMQFNHGVVTSQTDESGSFWCEVTTEARQTKLIGLVLTPTLQEVQLTEDLYPNTIRPIQSGTIVISDLDDTLLHSFVSSKLKQLKTLLFTTLEKRKAVVSTASLVRRFSETGAIPFYLSNSEQNLYPLLYRFLILNNFPAGPLLLRQYVHIRHWAWRKISEKENIHKRTMLEKILELFPDKKYILIGDNTQHDVSIYLDLARQHPHNILSIIIRRVQERDEDHRLLLAANPYLKKYNISIHYGTEFSDDLVENLNLKPLE